ncbi:hypothetical protein TNCV_1722541 [Trichonephila clavipes]|nr:hypothetical protein TNCV_1722541 [Trichonephila clavipes]
MCAFTPLVPPSIGHTSSPPNPSQQRNSPVNPDQGRRNLPRFQFPYKYQRISAYFDQQLIQERSEVNSYRSTRGLLATDHVILNPGQVTWTTPELASPLLTTTPTGGRFSSREI